MPELFLKLEELIGKGEMDRASVLQKEITGLIYDTLATSSLYAAAKAVLKLRGVECGGVRAPFLPLEEKDEATVCRLYEKIQDVMSRY